MRTLKLIPLTFFAGKKRLLTLAMLTVVLSVIFMMVSSCEPEKIKIGFSKIYIKNYNITNNIVSTNIVTTNNEIPTTNTISITNNIDKITNIQILEYKSELMENTVNEMKSTDTAIKNRGFQNFITNRNVFPWEPPSTSFSSFGHEEVFAIFRDDCENSIIIRIDNGYTNISDNEYYKKKYHYALFDPLGCGLVYNLSVTNINFTNFSFSDTE